MRLDFLAAILVWIADAIESFDFLFIQSSLQPALFYDGWDGSGQCANLLGQLKENPANLL